MYYSRTADGKLVNIYIIYIYIHLHVHIYTHMYVYSIFTYVHTHICIILALQMACSWPAKTRSRARKRPRTSSTPSQNPSVRPRGWRSDFFNDVEPTLYNTLQHNARCCNTLQCRYMRFSLNDNTTQPAALAQEEASRELLLGLWLCNTLPHTATCQTILQR